MQDRNLGATPEAVVIGMVVSLALVFGVAAWMTWQSPEPHRGTGHADWGGEGTLLAAPAGGPDLEITRNLEPGLMSIVVSNETFARELVDEASNNGERACLADLGPQEPEFHGQRWWVFSC